MADKQLAGGWQRGDRVAYLVDFKPNDICKGDVGTVLGPCNNAELNQKEERVLVDFGPKGQLNVLKGNIQHAPLPGGWRKGDRVAYLVDFKTQDISKGDVGTVLGPCNNAELKQKEERVLVDFGPKGQLNVLNGNIEHAPFPGGSTDVEISSPPLPVARAKRWGAGLEAPASGARHFFPQGFVVTRDASESIAEFGHSAAHVAQIVEVGRAKASTSPTPLASSHAAALFAYTEESPLYDTLNFTMRTPHTPSTPTDTDLKRYADYIFHTERALSALPAVVSEVQGMVYRGIKVLLNPNVYSPGKLVTWQAFSSSTRKQLATLDFVKTLPGRKLQGSLFIIDSITAKDVRHFSAVPSEEEVLFPPNSQFKVEKVVTSEPEKKSLLDDLRAYDMTDLDVYVLRQIA